MKHDKKINVWGSFASHGVGKFYLVEGILEQKQYTKMLEELVIPSAEDLFPDGEWLFQQDNDPKHTSKRAKQFMEENSIPLLPWPSQSPDLNPIENLWSILEQKLEKRTCNNEQELFKTLEDEWKRLPIDLLTRLVASMPRRCQAVIDVKGGHTKW